MSISHPRPVHTLTSPAFDTRPARIVNKELIPPDALRAMARSWQRGQFPSRPVEFHRLDNAYVVGDGLVLDSGLNPFEPALWPLTSQDVDRGRAEILAAIQSGQIPFHPEPTVLCKRVGHQNYGHWLIEMLPKSPLAAEVLGGETSAFVAATEGRLADIVSETLARAGTASGKVRTAGAEPHAFADLIVVTGLTRHGSYMSPIVVDIAGRLASQIAPTPQPDRLFVMRSDKTRRRLTNEDGLRTALERDGFHAITPGEISFEEQVNAFRGSDVIVGITGAEFSNLAFCRPNTRVVLLVPHTMPDTFFWFLAQHRQLDYTEVRGPVPGDPSGRSWNREFAVNLEDVQAALMASASSV